MDPLKKRKSNYRKDGDFVCPVSFWAIRRTGPFRETTGLKLADV